MEINVTNKVVVITGASKGLGAELARMYAKLKAKVVINYNNSYKDAKMLYDEITVYNNNILILKADLTKKDEVIHLYNETISTFGTIDVLINNAGTCSDNLIPMMTEKQWRDVLDINLTGLFLCCRFFSKEMIKRKNGKIINIASLKGQLGSEGQVNYSASKAGVIGFTKALAKELGMYGISVNAVCPGYIKTDLNSKSNNKNKIAHSMSTHPIEFSLHDFLNFMTFISSDLIKSVNGRVFNIDSRIL